ncbi:homoserine kinase [bacterium]|nr:homoserine kinase [bacterium]
MKVSVKVPATSANLGPGFDCLGLALPIYNIVTIEEKVLPGSGNEINIIVNNKNIDEASVNQVPTDENSIAYKSVEMLYSLTGQVPADLKITIETNIPIARGMGSSASVIVGSLMAANALLSNPADEAAILSIATEVEKHPDNIVPAVVGGLVASSIEDDGSVFYHKLEWPEDWHITLCIPDFELQTEIARSVLPKEVPMQDATFNAMRTAMFVEAVRNKDTELMKYALNDKLHQPYRMKLLPAFAEIQQSMKELDNVMGCVLSGAGPTILIISHGNNIDEIKQRVRDCWNEVNINGEIITTKVEPVGAKLVDVHSERLSSPQTI